MPQNDTNESVSQYLQPPTIVTDIEFAMYAIGLPIVCVPGAITNFLAGIVFLNVRMRSPINILLGSLSCIDSILLIVAGLYWSNIGMCTKFQAACRFVNNSTVVLYPLAVTFQFMSVWMCVLISFERLLAVKFPLKCKQYISTRRAYWSVGFVVLLAFSINLTCFFEFRHNSDGIVVQTELRHSPLYQRIRAYEYLLMMFLLPFILMISFNSVVIVSLKKSSKSTKQLMNCGVDSELSRKTSCVIDGRERQATIRAMLVTVTFILFNITALMANFFTELEHLTGKTSTTDVTQATVRRLCLIFGTLLVALNSAINCLVYYMVGRHFRVMFFKILCPRCSDQNANRPTANTDNHRFSQQLQSEFYNNRSLRAKLLDSNGEQTSIVLSRRLQSEMSPLLELRKNNPKA